MTYEKNMNKPAIAAVVPAAGIGSRMQASCPKQYLTLLERPVLSHTLATLLACQAISHVYVALAAHDRCFEQLAEAQHPQLSTVAGGDTRGASVLAGVQAAQQAGYDFVAVHDAARPCLSQQDLAQVIAAGVSHSDGAILATPVRDSMKYADAQQQIIANVDRTDVWQALTPQVFRTDLLLAALQQMGVNHPQMTDEASAVQYFGRTPMLVTGSVKNLKITHPEDLAIAAAYLSMLSSASVSTAE